MRFSSKENYLLFGFLLTIFSLVFGKLVDYNTKTPSYIKKGLGSQNSVNVFHSEYLLAESIHFQRKIIENSYIKHTNNKDNNLFSIKEDIEVKHSYLCCTKYSNIIPTISLLDAFKMESHITYSSSIDDLACFLSYLNKDDYNNLIGSQIDFLLIEPIPHILKFDLSIHKLQSLSYFSGGDIASSIIHPIIFDIQSKKKSIFLSIVFRKDSDNHSNKKLVKKWFKSFKNIDSFNIKETFENIYWHSSSDKDSNILIKPKTRRVLKIQESLKDITIKKSNIPSYMEKYEKIVMNNNKGYSNSQLPQEDNELTINQIHKQINKKWKLWKDIIDLLSLDQSLFDNLCGIDSLTNRVKYRHRNIYIKLPKEMLTFVSLNSSSDQVRTHKLFEKEFSEADVSAACFSFLVSVVASDNTVVKAAISQYPHLLNNVARQTVQSGSKGSEPFTDIGLTGKGMIVGVSDTGIDENSCYFIDRVNGKVPRSDDGSIIDLKFRKVIQYVNFSGSSGDYDSGHGSHVVGSLAGKCDLQSDDMNQAMNVYKGMASDAKIAFFDIGVNDADQDLAIPFQIASVIFSPAHKAGARIHSNSWGGGYWYDAFCVEVDEYLYENEDFTAFFAGGNDGSSGPETVLSPGLSKNAIAVGCSENEHSGNFNKNFIASFSSHGPANDGRIKPDIITPGFSVTSVKAHSEGSNSASCETTSKAGTSMATPVAAGNAVLVRQYFMDPKFWKSFCNPTYHLCKVGTFAPKGSLVKALLLHAGEQMSVYDGAGTVTGKVNLGETPDIFQGYGRVNLKNVLPTQKEENSPFSLFVDEGSLSQLTEMRYSVQVLNNNIPLRVTLSWYDPPNEIFVAKCLLHDLDLVINDPEGLVFYGNSRNSLGKPVVGSSRDEVNNNEQVHITAPRIGTWTVHVQAKALTESSYQNFSLVITTNGIVSADATSTPISSSLLKQCQVGSGSGSMTPKMSVDISLYSRVLADGWKSIDSYTIEDETANTIYSGYFNERHLLYKVDSPCLPKGCYSASLNMAGVQSPTRGMQISIAECGIYLTPLFPVQKFCIDQPTPFTNNNNIDSTIIEYFPKGSCASLCQQFHHIDIPLLLYEGEGAGWSGSYYFITPLNAITEQLNTLKTSTVAAGNLEWGFEKIENVCLPTKSQCYRLQLSYPKDTEEFPEMMFGDSYLIDDSSGSRVIHKDKLCPFEVNITVSLAQFCIEDNIEMSYVEFYIETKVISDFGQVSEDWNSFLQIQSNIIKIGICTLNATLVNHNKASVSPSLQVTADPIISPSRLPVNIPDTFSPSVVIATENPPISPSRLPIVVTDSSSLLPSLSLPLSTTPTPKLTDRPIVYNPTTAPLELSQPSYEPFIEDNYLGGDVDMTFNNHSFACFKDCPSLFITSDASDICNFLTETYFLCTSFSIAAGLCKKPDCAATCSTRDWCYFGSLGIINCPVTSFEWTWKGYTRYSDRIRVECERSINKKKSSTPVSSQNTTITSAPTSAPINTKDYSTSTKIVVVGVFLFVMFLIILACVQYSWRSSTPQQMINNPLDSNSNSVINAIHDSDKNIVNDKSFSNSIKKMIIRGNKNSSNSNQQYEMVPTISLKDAFTIEGEDDDEEAGFGDDEEDNN